MALTDPIADALTTIRNANKARKERVDLKTSKLLVEVAKILKRERFIHDYRMIENKPQNILRVYLRKENEPVRKISKIVRISRPGLRRYVGSVEIPKVLNGMGLCILTTSQGILTGEEAKRRNVGGELLVKVW